MGVSAVEISAERAFIVGGMAKDTNPRDSVRQITWTFSQERPKWDNFPPMPTARYNAHLGDNKARFIKIHCLPYFKNITTRQFLPLAADLASDP